MPEHTGTDRPAGRTTRTREAVHRAVVELLDEPGTELTMAAVAERSGVHRATLYRRWKSVESIVLDIAVEQVTAESPIPATGNLHSDLTAYVHQLLVGLQQSGSSSLLKALMAAAAQTQDVVEITEIVEPRVQQFQGMLDAANITRIDGLRLVELILAPAYLWAQFGVPLDPDAGTARLVDSVMAAATYEP